MQKVTFSPAIVFLEENPTRYVKEDELEIFFSFEEGEILCKTVRIVKEQGGVYILVIFYPLQKMAKSMLRYNDKIA
jgi:hypothetical protein